MRMTEDYLLVEMDLTHNKLFNVGGVELIRPDDWLDEDSTTVNDGNKYATNLDMRQVNPQIATVIIGDKDGLTQAGERIFVHFNCISNGQEMEYQGKKYLAIRAWQVYFVILGENQYRMLPDNYLGVQVFAAQEQTKSGIFLNSGTKREICQVRITHVPEKGAVCEVGDIAISMDDWQYELVHDGKTYIKLKKDFIAGIRTDHGFTEN